MLLGCDITCYGIQVSEIHSGKVTIVITASIKSDVQCNQIKPNYSPSFIIPVLRTELNLAALS